MATVVAGQQSASIPADVMSAIQSAVHNGGGSTADINSLVSQASSLLGTNFASVTAKFSSEIASASSAMLAPTGGASPSQQGSAGSNPSRTIAPATSTPASNSNRNSMSASGLALVAAFAYGLWQ
ncbi:hypothetical protein K493DRAFT_356416 [Basidiobolus meristosporus CBS 931.73]|uniref:Uncharacterized protein n=1 Tax=Basidiobolus meristosporus CBS 931.73 TaxID=1314790 RepID=A0A1Y1XYG4_9FUNG|nr:hypothetical protein K493DRAFT_356416 [Basidiobolus meristosporus CBS 931.73]|eukprot:ORX90781.1 hypothetical protein K493DRAFT_356416 [Basidiobolus meristosporus CBS 931.73]